MWPPCGLPPAKSAHLLLSTLILFWSGFLPVDFILVIIIDTPQWSWSSSKIMPTFNFLHLFKFGWKQTNFKINLNEVSFPVGNGFMALLLYFLFQIIFNNFDLIRYDNYSRSYLTSMHTLDLNCIQNQWMQFKSSPLSARVTTRREWPKTLCGPNAPLLPVFSRGTSYFITSDC